MIKFFRKIRQQLLTENKFSKYLLYAIGEIILVVIGILIALQINNRNEELNQKETLNNIYRIIAQDIKSDSVDTATALKFIEDRKKLFNMIFSDSLTIDYVAQNQDINSILTDLRVINIEKRGYNLLQDFDYQSNQEKDSLSFQIINFYTNSIFYTQKIEDLILQDLVKTNDLWKQKDWYSSIIQNSPHKGYLDYILNDQEFKNLCAFRYTLYYDNYAPTLKQFQDGSERILKAIDEQLIDNN
ncbi:hypothetical protein [uncultured Croceitalea sp.]|uniref:hypothetical protein n=1 Tax=uncultured Croceitalea sp. TaxID=1798908 RepID=UPI00330634ED